MERHRPDQASSQRDNETWDHIHLALLGKINLTICGSSNVCAFIILQMGLRAPRILRNSCFCYADLSSYCLAGAELTIAGIAKTGQNITHFIEPLVNGG